jgi:hypothetical protein
MKFIKILLLSLFLTSCFQRSPRIEPIEKYKNKGIIVVSEPVYYNLRNNAEIRVKTKDSVFYIQITSFDAENLKPGDTLKSK